MTITGADVDDLRQDPPPNFNDGPNDDPNDERVTPAEDEGLAWLDPMKCGLMVGSEPFAVPCR